jgi:tetratricopeptide (TPR) repeat protein
MSRYFILLVFSLWLIYLSSFTNTNNTIYGQLQTEEGVNAVESDDVKELISKGNSLYDLGNYASAIEYYDKALAIDPNHIHALYGKGLALDRLGKYKEAIEYYDKVLDIDPNNVDALNGKSLALNQLGK